MIPARSTTVRGWYANLDARRSELAGSHRALLSRLRTGAVLLILVVAGGFAAQTMRQWLALSQHPLNLDFSLYRASAIQGMQFGWNHLYDLVAQRQIYSDQQRANPTLGPMVWAPNVFTPPLSWLAIPFTYLPVPAGYLIWSVLILASTSFGYVVLAPGGLLDKLAQVALAFCPYLVLLSLAEGQVTSFQIAAIAACWMLLRRGREGWAGLTLAAGLVLKPQTMMLLPLTLLVAGRFRAFAFCAIATAVIDVAALANVGFDGAIAYVQRLHYASSHPGEYLMGTGYNLALHFRTRLGQVGAPALAGLLALWVAWRHRHAGPEVPISAGLIGSLLVASYLHLNDLLTLFPAAWLTLRAHQRWWLGVSMAGGYAIVLLCTAAGTPRWSEGLLLFEIGLLVVLAVIRVPDAPARRPGHLTGTADLRTAAPA